MHRRIEEGAAAAARLLRRRARDRLRGDRHHRDPDGGVRAARLHDRQYRQALPRIRHHARRLDLLLGRRGAHAHADAVLEADGAGPWPHPAHDRAGLREDEQRLSLAALAGSADSGRHPVHRLPGVALGLRPVPVPAEGIRSDGGSRRHHRPPPGAGGREPRLHPRPGEGGRARPHAPAGAGPRRLHAEPGGSRLRASLPGQRGHRDRAPRALGGAHAEPAGHRAPDDAEGVELPRRARVAGQPAGLRRRRRLRPADPVRARRSRLRHDPRLARHRHAEGPGDGQVRQHGLELPRVAARHPRPDRPPARRRSRRLGGGYRPHARTDVRRDRGLDLRQPRRRISGDHARTRPRTARRRTISPTPSSAPATASSCRSPPS